MANNFQLLMGTARSGTLSVADPKKKKQEELQVAQLPAQVPILNVGQSQQPVQQLQVRGPRTAAPKPFNFADAANNVGKFVLGGSAKFVNTTYSGLLKPSARLLMGEDPFKVQNETNKELLSDKGGLLDAGTFYAGEKSTKENLADFAKRFGGAGLSTAAEVVPVARGTSLIAKPGLNVGQKVSRGALEGAGYGAAASTGSQLVENGTVNPLEVAKSTAAGAVLGGAIPAVAGGAQKIVNPERAEAAKALALNTVERVRASRAINSQTQTQTAMQEKVLQNAISQPSPSTSVSIKPSVEGMIRTQAQYGDAYADGKAVQEYQSRNTKVRDIQNKIPKSQLSSELAVPSSVSEPLLQPRESQAQRISLQNRSNRQDLYENRSQVENLRAPQQNNLQQVISQNIERPVSSYANNTTNSGKGQVKTRGFAETVANSDMSDDALKAVVSNQNLTYKVRNTKDLIQKASNLARDDEDAAYRMAINGNDDKAQAVGQELVKKFQAEGRYEQAISLIESISKKATESGRANQILATYNKLTPSGALRFTQRQIDQYNEASGLVKNGVQVGNKAPAKLSEQKAQRISGLAEQIQNLPDGEAKDALTLKLLQEMNSAAPTPLLTKLTSIWRAGLLTSLRTLEGGVLGNASKQVLDIPSNAVAAGIDKFITAPVFNKGVRSNVFTLKGGLDGFDEGIDRGIEMFKTGIDARDVANGYENKPINYEDGNKIINAFGKASDYVYRAMGTVDNPFYYSALRRANREEALIEASRRGLKGSERKTFINDFTAQPDSAASQRAILKAQEAVFQNDTVLGTFAAGFKKLPNKINDPEARAATQAVVDVIVPFSKIPSAVATALFDYSPAGAVINFVKQGVGKYNGKPLSPEQFNKSIAKSTVGTVAGIYTGSQLYNAGAFTLEAPNDPSERQLWELEGKKPFSVRIGDRWVGLNYIQPLGSLMAIGAGYERAKANGENPIVSALASGMKAVTDQSFLQGVSGAISAVQDPQKSAGTFANSTVGSLVPNIVRDAARASDSKEREVNDPYESLRAGIPGLRSQNLPQRDPFGNEIERRQGVIGTFADPFKSTKSKSDPLTDEMRRLYNIDPTDPNNRTTPTKLAKQQSIGGEKAVLTPEQLDTFEQLVGSPTQQTLIDTIRSEKYKALSDEDKAKTLKSQISAIRNNAKEGFANSNELKNKKGKVIDFSDAEFKKSKIKIGNGKAAATSAVTGTPTGDFLDEAESIETKDRASWNKKEVSKKHRTLVDGLNSQLPEGLPKLPYTNEIAKLQADFEKRSKEGKWEALQTDKEKKKLLSNAYKTQLSDKERFYTSLSDTELVANAQNGTIKKEELERINQLDTALVLLGMYPIIGKKARAQLGLGQVAAGGSTTTAKRTSSKGRKTVAKGRKSTGRKVAGKKGRATIGFKAPKTSEFKQVRATSATRKLLSSAGSQIGKGIS